MSQSIGKLTNENFPNFAGVYTPHFAINPHFLSNYDCTHSVLCNLTFTLFVLAMVTVDGFSLVSDPMKIADCGIGPKSPNTNPPTKGVASYELFRRD